MTFHGQMLCLLLAELSSLCVEEAGIRGFFPLRLSQSLACAFPLYLCKVDTGREGRFSVVIASPFLSLGTFFSGFAF